MSCEDAVISPLIERLIKARPGRSRGIISRLMKQRDEKRPKHLFETPEVRSWTKDEAVEAVKRARNDNMELTKKRLHELHENDPSSFPSLSAIAAAFNTDPIRAWSEVTRLAGVARRSRTVRPVSPGDIVGGKQRYDALYFLELFNKFGLTTVELYEQARNKYPEVVPPLGALRREIGGINSLKYLSRISSCEKQLNDLVSLMNELGRWPKKKLCKERGINRAFLERKFGGRIELENLCRDIIAIQRSEKVSVKERSDED